MKQEELAKVMEKFKLKTTDKISEIESTLAPPKSNEIVVEETYLRNDGIVIIFTRGRSVYTHIEHFEELGDVCPGCISRMSVDRITPDGQRHSIVTQSKPSFVKNVPSNVMCTRCLERTRTKLYEGCFYGLLSIGLKEEADRFHEYYMKLKPLHEKHPICFACKKEVNIENNIACLGGRVYHRDCYPGKSEEEEGEKKNVVSEESASEGDN